MAIRNKMLHREPAPKLAIETSAKRDLGCVYCVAPAVCTLAVDVIGESASQGVDSTPLGLDIAPLDLRIARVRL